MKYAKYFLSFILFIFSLNIIVYANELDKSLDALSKQIVVNLNQHKNTTIAIVEFSDLQGNVSTLGKYIVEELTTRLVMTQKFEIVERQLLNKVLDEHKLNLTGLIDPASAKELGKILGVSAIITGTITELDKSVKINARLIATETGTILTVAAVEVKKDGNIKKLISQVITNPQNEQLTSIQDQAKPSPTSIEKSTSESLSTPSAFNSPNDSFDGTIIDNSKWENRSYNGGKSYQNGRLLFTTSPDQEFSLSKLISRYRITGDFDIQVDFQLGSGWVEPRVPCGNITASMSIFVNDNQIINFRRSNSSDNRDSFLSFVGLYYNNTWQKSNVMICKALSGKLRMVRVGSDVTLKYDIGRGWKDFYKLTSFPLPVYVKLEVYTLGVQHASVTYFDNFRVNSGSIVL